MIEIYLNHTSGEKTDESNYHYKFFKAPPIIIPGNERINSLIKIEDPGEFSRVINTPKLIFDKLKLSNTKKTTLDNIFIDARDKFKDQVYIAGSYLVDMYRVIDTNHNDIDIFVKNEDDYKYLGKYLISINYSLKHEAYYTSTYCIVDKSKLSKIQLIKRFNDTPEMTVGSFDIGYLCMYYCLNDSELYINQRCIDETLNDCVVLYTQINKIRYIKHIKHKYKTVYLAPEQYINEVSPNHWYPASDNKSIKQYFNAETHYVEKCYKCQRVYPQNKNHANKLFTNISTCDSCLDIKITNKNTNIRHHVGFVNGFKNSKVYHIPSTNISKSFKPTDIYEVITDDNKLPKVLYFNIKIIVDDDKLNYHRILYRYINKFNKILREKVNNNTSVELSVYASMRKNKICAHILGSEYKYTMVEVKKIASIIRQYIDHIDMSVYKDNALFRLPFTHKRKNGVFYSNTILQEHTSGHITKNILVNQYSRKKYRFR
jgi:hypothetical protein